MQYARGILQTGAYTGFTLIFAKQKCKQIPSSPQHSTALLMPVFHGAILEKGFELKMQYAGGMLQTSAHTDFTVILRSKMQTNPFFSATYAGINDACFFMAKSEKRDLN